MYLTVKQQVKHLSKEDYANLKDLCHTAKNLANEAIYNVRQYYFENRKYLREQNGIDFHRQEESYTSKASFFDGDSIPEYGKSGACHTFSGKRIHRGMYRTASGRLINADVNGALNILKKSNVVSPRALYSRGEVDTPVRIRIA